MEITEVRVRLVNGGAERLRAFCSVTLDGDFVIRDLKVIDGTNGHFVAMPSRKLAYRCGRCGNKNHLRAKFCNECGGKLSERRLPRDPNGRSKLHVDVAHPINTACRERIQKAVIEAFEAECEKSKLPDYQPAAAEDGDDFEGSEYGDLVAELKEAAAKRHEERSGRAGTPRPVEPVDDEPTNIEPVRVDRGGWSERESAEERVFEPVSRLDAPPPRPVEPPTRREATPPRRPEPLPRLDESDARLVAPTPPRPATPAPPPPKRNEPEPDGFSAGL